MTVRVMLSPPKTYASLKRPWAEDLENAIALWDRGIFIDKRPPARDLDPVKIPWIQVTGEMGDMYLYWNKWV